MTGRPKQESIHNIVHNFGFADGDSWDEVKANYDTNHPFHREMRQSIKDNGVREPIKIDYDQSPPEVVDGHTRLMHAESLGHTHVPVEHSTFADAHYYASLRTAARPKHEIPADGPMTLRYVRNPGTSQSYGNFGEQYGQHVEPHGRYMSERSGDHAPEGWETGEVHFHNPLHVPFGGGYQEPSNWKHQLSDRYDGKRGKALSKAVAKDGHDAIVTHDDYGTSEIVDLTHLHKRSVKTASGHPFIHVSPREFKPGDKIEPADDHGGQSTFDYSDLDRIYLSHPDHAEYWGNTVGAAGGHREVHHYEVEPHDKPEFQISSDNEHEYTSSGATVKRKVRTQKVDPSAYTREQIHPSLLAGGEGWGKEHDRSESQYAQRVPSWEKKSARAPEGVRAISLPCQVPPSRNAPSHRQASKEPNQRLFGPTFGLDHRLFEGERLKDDVRAAVLAKFDAFCVSKGHGDWRSWGKLVFFGSEASEWTSKSLEGNGDFDLSFGINFSVFFAEYPGAEKLGTTAVAQEWTDAMHVTLNDPNWFVTVDGVKEGPFDQTWFCNEQGYDIEKIKPYSAFDVAANTWIVRPPHLPDWDISQFPEGHALVQEAHAVAAYVKAVLALREPYRSQQATALWEHLHSDRSRAFGEQGEGWYDPGNVLEKYLDQTGLWQKLVDARMQARDHPEMLATPSGWSNDPHGLSAGRS